MKGVCVFFPESGRGVCVVCPVTGMELMAELKPRVGDRKSVKEETGQPFHSVSFLEVLHCPKS